MKAALWFLLIYALVLCFIGITGLARRIDVLEQTVKELQAK